MSSPSIPNSAEPNSTWRHQIGRLWWQFVPKLLRSGGPSITFLHRHGWLILSILMAVVIVLGTSGFYRHLLQRQPRPTISEAIYLSLQLFTLESGVSVQGVIPWRLEVARFLGAFVMVAAAARALALFFYDRFQLGLLKVFGHQHIIICGLGRKGWRLVEELRKRGEWVVVVETDSENEGLERCRELGTTIIIGSSTDEYSLLKAMVHRAKSLVSVIGTDGTNVETAVLARELNSSRRGSMLNCIIHVTDRNLRTMLTKTKFATDREDAFELHYFDVFEICAGVMLRESQFLPAVRNSLVVDCHLLVIGFGRLGTTLVLRAIRDWMVDHPNSPQNLRITILDRDGRQKEEEFRRLHPELCNQFSLSFIEMELHQAEFSSAQFLFDGEGNINVSAVYVCLGDDSLGMLAALTIDEFVRPHSIPLIVRLSEQAGFAAALTTDEGSEHSVHSIRAVGLLELSCNVDLVLDGAHEILARAIHQGYVRHHLSLGETTEQNRSLVTWENLSAEIRNSNRDRARRIGEHLEQIHCRMVPIITGSPRILNFTPEEIERLAEMEHERWRQEKLAPSLTTDHPSLVDLHLSGWMECPADVQQFNRDIVNRMPSILAKADFEIRRESD